jgi:hypothetical protein
MSIIVKNSQLSNETVSALNILVDLDISAASAFRLSRIIKEVNSIVDDKVKMEKKILDKWIERDLDGNPTKVVDESGKVIEGAVNISNMDAFSQEMQDLLDIENEIPYPKINFDDLSLVTAKVKDLIKLDFLFV